MKKIKLAVIFGGNSSEYPVSLHSAASTIRNIDTAKYEVLLIGISRSGNWFYYEGSVDAIEHDTWMDDTSLCEVVLSPSTKQGFILLEKDGTYKPLEVDCILPILHGKNGEDGTLQGLLELTQIPYVGCNHISSSLAMDKAYTHIICEAAGIKMAPYILAINNQDIDFEQIQKDAEANLTLPLFVKPANAGSSFGITKIEAFSQLKEALLFAFEHDKKVVIENGIDGFEVGCAVMGNEQLTIGEVDEIDTRNHFFDYEAKYALENTEIVCPARIDKETEIQVKEMAKKIYTTLGCSGLARVDMFVNSKKEVYFNEINTLPGFTDTSRFPSMMNEIGIDFTSLIDHLVAFANEK